MTPAAAPEPAHIHATAFVVGEAGVLVRGASGAGKSRLTRLVLAEAARCGLFGRLVGDDRVAVAVQGGRLVARGHPAVAARMEHRGEGIVTVAYVAAGVVRVVVDLEPGPAPRLPTADERRATIHGLALPRLVLRAGLADLDVADVLEQLQGIVRV